MIKHWNGRGHGKYMRSHIYVSAHSQKEAAELVSKVIKIHIGISEIKTYYSPCWGATMIREVGLINEIGVWAQDNPFQGGKIRRIL